MADITIFEKNAKKRLLTAITSVQGSLDVLRSSINDREHHQLLSWHVDHIKNQMKLISWLTAEYEYARTDEIKRESAKRTETTTKSTTLSGDGWGLESENESFSANGQSNE